MTTKKSNPRPPRRGRPPVAASERSDAAGGLVRVWLRIPTALLERIDQLAERTGDTRERVVLGALGAGFRATDADRARAAARWGKP